MPKSIQHVDFAKRVSLLFNIKDMGEYLWGSIAPDILWELEYENGIGYLPDRFQGFHFYDEEDEYRVFPKINFDSFINDVGIINIIQSSFLMGYLTHLALDHANREYWNTLFKYSDNVDDEGNKTILYNGSYEISCKDAILMRWNDSAYTANRCPFPTELNEYDCSNMLYYKWRVNDFNAAYFSEMKRYGFMVDVCATRCKHESKILSDKENELIIQNAIKVLRKYLANIFVKLIIGD